jgi:HEPN domain-containing protein
MAVEEAHMGETRIDIENQAEYWQRGSQLDWESARRLWSSGQDLHWALFLGHLACEKALKALVVRHTSDYAPRTHNLLRLAEVAALDLNESQVTLLSVVNQFNLNIRYPDQQYDFYRRCTPEFTARYMEQIEEFLQWLSEQV